MGGWVGRWDEEGWRGINQAVKPAGGEKQLQQRKEQPTMNCDERKEKKRKKEKKKATVRNRDVGIHSAGRFGFGNVENESFRIRLND